VEIPKKIGAAVKNSAHKEKDRETHRQREIDITQKANTTKLNKQSRDKHNQRERETHTHQQLSKTLQPQPHIKTKGEKQRDTRRDR